MAIERAEIERLAKDRDDERAILERNIYGRLRELLDGQLPTSGNPYDTPLDPVIIESISVEGGAAPS